MLAYSWRLRTSTKPHGIPGVTLNTSSVNQFDQGKPNDPDTARKSAQALLDSGVDVIIGPATSSVALQVIDNVTCHGVIMFSPSNTAPEFTTYRDQGLYFRTAPSNVVEAKALGNLVVADHHSKVVLMSRDDEFGRSLRVETEKQITDASPKGSTIIADSFNFDNDPAALDRAVQRVKKIKPEAIVLIGFTEVPEILERMIHNELGPTRSRNIYLSGDSMTETMVSQVSAHNRSALAGTKGTLLGAESGDFIRRLKIANPGLHDLTYAAQAYDAVVITALAAAVGNTANPAAIAAKINDVTRGSPECRKSMTCQKCTSFATCIELVNNSKEIDYDGASGPLDFADPGEPHSATYVISEIKADGTISEIGRDTVRY